MSEADIYLVIYAGLSFLAGFFVDFFFDILGRHYGEHRDRVVQKRVLQGDLKARLRNFCSSWEDRDCIIPATDLRKDLVSLTKDIRESLNDEFAQLDEEEKTAIRKVTNDFLKIAGKFPSNDNAAWSEKVKGEMEEIRWNIKRILETWS
jgi:hypothetical protein